jgi:hypothetical protein
MSQRVTLPGPRICFRQPIGRAFAHEGATSNQADLPCPTISGNACLCRLRDQSSGRVIFVERTRWLSGDCRLSTVAPTGPGEMLLDSLVWKKLDETVPGGIVMVCVTLFNIFLVVRQIIQFPNERQSVTAKSLRR